MKLAIGQRPYIRPVTVSGSPTRPIAGMSVLPPSSHSDLIGPRPVSRHLSRTAAGSQMANMATSSSSWARGPRRAQPRCPGCHPRPRCRRGRAGRSGPFVIALASMQSSRHSGSALEHELRSFRPGRVQDHVAGFLGCGLVCVGDRYDRESRMPDVGQRETAEY